MEEIFCNIESLKEVLKKLDDKKNDVQRSVDAAKRNGATIKDQVQSWLEEVSQIFREAKELENKVNKQRRCLYGLCPSLKSLYSLSRKATEIAQRVLDLKLDEGLCNNAANPAPVQQLGSIISSEGFKGFESRKYVMNDVLSTLRNEKTRIIGICGMGGVGKTTMVREIIKRLEGTSLFDDVLMATVSAIVNIGTIQTDIADSLGMKFVEESESRRAPRLHERIKQSKKILIILDDVWLELKLQDVGIPFSDHEECKILLTSRNEEVCKVMSCKDDIFRVQALNKEEAWELFSATVGESLDNNPELSHVEKLIVDECKGLPIAIITVGKALLPSNGKHEWNTALQELKNSLPENIPGMEPEVYSCIKVSYDKLNSNEVKSCFLLCCLFPEDYDIPIEYLVRYGLGRAPFRNTNTVEDVRNKVHSFVGQLKRRYLLLDSLKKECIKMHDIVRDVAISIASKDPHRFMVRSFDTKGGDGGWLGVQKATNQEHYSAISLIDFKLDEDNTDGLECQKLELLQLKNFSNSEYSHHFKRLKELKVLAFLGMDMSKILSFARSEISKLPKEIRDLQRLRILDATDCKGLEEIPHGVLCNLGRLEELYMAKSFLNWEPTIGSKDEMSMASLDEVTSLSIHLKVLAIEIPDGQIVQNGFLLKNEHIRLHLSINTSQSHEEEDDLMPGYLFEKSLMLYGDVTEYMEFGTVGYLLKQSEDLSLHYTCNLKSLMLLKQSDDQVGFQRLKVLSIMYDKDIEYLMNGTDWTRQHLDKCSFMYLRSIAIHSCHELKYVFSLSVAQNLVHLQSLTVRSCTKVEEIISKERMEDDNASHMIKLSRLTTLKLQYLHKLLGFYTSNQHDSTYEIIKPNDESVNKMKETRNDDQVAGSTSSKALVGASCNALFPSNCISWLPNLEELVVSKGGQGSEENNEPVVNVVFDLEGHDSAFSQLQTFRVGYLNEVTPANLQTSSASDNLEDLHVEWCNLLEMIFLVQETPSTQAFDKLRELKLRYLPTLNHIWEKGLQVSSGFGNLRLLRVQGCDNLRYLFSLHIAKLLTCLETIEVSECSAMEKIVGEGEGEGESIKDELTFPHVKYIQLEYLPKLEFFCSQAYTLKWSLALKKVRVRKCPKLKAFAPESLYV
ncbi:disease resistance protein RPS5-like [Prunus avium]|uniref:Disease resistance protein RPS5-like n=1 Tax=Prunus avium TaxID=42229 RepID=A0A6P5T997_PRUAV|nr:disease resistance protein RPS5-like [Prunus avium]